MEDAVELPERLSIGVEHRTRYEFLDEQFRAGRPGRDEVVVMRTRLHARLEVAEWFTAGAEFQDSRFELGDRNTPINTTIVNAAELLQVYGELSERELFGGSALARFGRITMDVGSRRLVARNRYRNTTNAFTGFELSWSRDGQQTLRGFFTLPLQRLPNAPRRVRHNQVEWDREDVEVIFWGLFGSAALPWGDPGELYVFGLHEDDVSGRPTRDRRHYTPGFRLLRAPERGGFDYEFETALQYGKSRIGLASTRDLDHSAHFHHVELGYSFDLPWSPRLAVLYDYASGDDDPDDGDNNRFDTLFGARRAEFGPTSIYGPFARSNINTPGGRLTLEPHPVVDAFFACRGFWLASKRDAWVGSGLQDPTGRSGSFLGTQIDLRVRWKVLPGNAVLELGYAHLFAGEFIDDAPGSNGQDANYFYSQVLVSF